MFDAKLRPSIDPPLNFIGAVIAKTGIKANQITLSGAILAIGAGLAIAQHHYLIGLVFIGLNRLFDGLDGAVARATKKTDFGGYLDIVCDFIFYLSVPIGFAFANQNNQIVALLLISSFTLTGISFMAYATLAQKQGLETDEHGQKSFFYNTGLAEGAETIFVFAIMCLFPNLFVQIALVFIFICLLTIVQRSINAIKTFK